MTVLREFIQMIWNLVSGHYPDFITGREYHDQVIAFCYHNVGKNEFEKHLQFLKKNGYKALNIKELNYRVLNNQIGNMRNIVLTFDDGLENLYSIVYPLLKKYQYQAVVFIAPAWINKPGLLSWQQIQEMHQSGLIDFQSHSYSHSRIPIASQIIDFYHPKMASSNRWLFPLLTDDCLEVDSIPGIAWGTPLYRTASSISGQKKFLIDPSLHTFCIEFVEDHGGKHFFYQPFWRLKIKKGIKDFFRNHQRPELYESEKDQFNRIRKEIEQSKKIIEKQLHGKEVLSFSYPYNEYGEITNRLLNECGYRIIFGGLRDNPFFHSANSQDFFFTRVSGDFVMRLPGDDRYSLFKLVFNKGWRRIRSGTPY